MKHLCVLLLFASVVFAASGSAAPAPAAAKPAEAKPAATTAAKPAEAKPASVLTPLFRTDPDPTIYADPEKAEKLIRQRAELRQKIQAERKRLLQEDNGAKQLREEILLLNRKLASLLETKKSMIELNSQLLDLDIAISRLKLAPEPVKEPETKEEAKADAKADAKTDAKADAKPAVSASKTDAKTDAKPAAKTETKPAAKTDSKPAAKTDSNATSKKE